MESGYNLVGEQRAAIAVSHVMGSTPMRELEGIRDLDRTMLVH